MGISEFDDVAAHLLEPEESVDSNRRASTWTKATLHRNARGNCVRGASPRGKRVPTKVWRVGWPVSCPT